MSQNGLHNVHQLAMNAQCLKTILWLEGEEKKKRNKLVLNMPMWFVFIYCFVLERKMLLKNGKLAEKLPSIFRTESEKWV